MMPTNFKINKIKMVQHKIKMVLDKKINLLNNKY